MSFKNLEAQLQARFEYLRCTEGLTKSELARRLKTSRVQVDRLLNLANNNVTFDSLLKLSYALGKRLQLRFVEE